MQSNAIRTYMVNIHNLCAENSLILFVKSMLVPEHNWISGPTTDHNTVPQDMVPSEYHEVCWGDSENSKCIPM